MPIRDIEAYSEYAKVRDGGEGFIVGACLETGPIRILSSYRDYGVDFTNPYSDGFAQPDGEDDDADEVGIYIEMEYKVLPKFRVKASSDHWHHPSTLLRDRESKIKLYWDLSSTTRLRLLREWDDEDIERAGQERIKTSFWADLKPTEGLKVSLYLRTTEKKDEVDGFARVRVGYMVLEGLEIGGYVRVKDRDLYKEGKSSTRYYLQLRDRLDEHLSLLLRYTNTAHSSDYEGLNPEHRYRFSLDVAW